MTDTPKHRRAAPAPRTATRAEDPNLAPLAAKVLASDPDPDPRADSKRRPAKAAPAPAHTKEA